MKTRITIATVFIVFVLTFCSRAATEVVKISSFPNTATMSGSELFLLAIPGVTNKNITYDQLRAAIGTNGSVTYITTNLYSSNAYITNLTVNTVTNVNLYSSNAYITNLVVNNGYITNLYVSNAFITNLAVQFITNNTTYTTNLFVTTIYTNFFLYSTNIYNSDVTVSNYFATNVFNNTYMSNFFLTNQVFYETNLFLTYLTTTNFIDYISNVFVSNFFNTNIFVNNSYVSNFYTTNLFNTIEVITNNTFNVAWALTNATLYGTTTFSPVSGQASGRIILSSAGVDAISLSASNGSIAAAVMWFNTNLWSGPTGTLSMNLEDQFYLTTTDMSITNLGSLPPTGKSAGVILTLSNSTAANKTLYLPSTVALPERTSSVTLSNASQGMLSIRYHPRAGTNAVWRQW